MKWLDVCGPPGVGKSAICDPLWHPHAFRPENRLPPRDWQPFLDEITRLFLLIRKHWSIVPAIRMNRRSVRKMATVARMAVGAHYIQTGLVQRGLGFGWRLAQLGIDLDELRPYFELMPVSIGVAALTASVETVQARNNARKDVPETAHEDRAFMVPLMQKPLEIALDVLRGRGVPLIEIDTEQQPVEDARAAVVLFADENAHHGSQDGPRCEVEVLQPPVWW